MPTFAEAYKLMWYSCSCGHRECVWNSRDGITPFGTNCPSCGKTMQHRSWAADVYKPDHHPYYGQLVWRDGTPDDAARIARRRADIIFEESDSEADRQELTDHAVDCARRTASGEIKPGSKDFIELFAPGFPVGFRYGTGR